MRFGNVKQAPFESLGAVSYLPSTVTMALSLHHLRDKARYWWKIAIFSCAFDTPIMGVPVGILPSCLVWKKLEWWGYWMAIKV